MKILIKKAVQGLLKRLNLWVIRYDTLQKLEDTYYQLPRWKKFTKMLLADFDNNYQNELINNIPHSRATISQDLFVLKELNCKKGGYFVEFGAYDGIGSSNTYLLEKKYGWKGIVCEPARYLHKKLHENRNCHIETQAVWKESNQKLVFKEVRSEGSSSIDGLGFQHYLKGTPSFKYEVDSISLVDLLEKYNMPKVIDFLSMDSEGSEWEILNAFNFEKYEFRTITVEHHYKQSTREKIHNLLSKHGYTNKYASISEIDDWYVKESLL